MQLHVLEHTQTYMHTHIYTYESSLILLHLHLRLLTVLMSKFLSKVTNENVLCASMKFSNKFFLKIKITNEIYKFLVLDEMLITHVRQGGPADRGTCHQA